MGCCCIVEATEIVINSNVVAERQTLSATKGNYILQNNVKRRESDNKQQKNDLNLGNEELRKTDDGQEKGCEKTDIQVYGGKSEGSSAKKGAKNYEEKEPNNMIIEECEEKSEDKDKVNDRKNEGGGDKDSKDREKDKK